MTDTMHSKNEMFNVYKVHNEKKMVLTKRTLTKET